MKKFLNHLKVLFVHKFWVAYYLIPIIITLIWRTIIHDLSKLSKIETEKFIKVNHLLKNSTYGSVEYFDNIKKIQPAIDHHYACNKHHPEHYLEGIYDMSLIDIIEMFADWRAAARRHKDGNVNHSIEVNSERFNMDEQLTKILKNSVK